MNNLDLLWIATPKHVKYLHVFTFTNRLVFYWKDYAPHWFIEGKPFSESILIDCAARKIVASDNELKMLLRIVKEQAYIHSCSWVPDCIEYTNVISMSRNLQSFKIKTAPKTAHARLKTIKR